MIKFIENLLKSPPPQFNGEIIDYKPLGEVCELKNGYTPSKSKPEFWEGGDIPWFRMEDIRTNGRILSDSIQHITREAVKGGKLFPAGSIILSTTATIGEHALLLCNALANQQITNISIKEAFMQRLMPKYLFYYMFKVGEWCRNNVNSSSFASVEIAKLKKVIIPIPPMRVQTEIVRILDMFSELINELSAELELRKKQYYYYREKLLKFTNDTAQFLPLSEVVRTITAPTKLKKEAYCNSGRTPIIDQSVTFISAYTDEDLKTLPSGEYVIFGDHSEHIKYVDFSFIQGADGLKILQVKSKDILTKYIYYAFLNFYKRENTYKRHWLTAKETIIPIPPIEEQERIVAILDKFDSLVNSLSEGLPAEINLRQKQYEYYRNALLSFN